MERKIRVNRKTVDSKVEFDQTKVGKERNNERYHNDYSPRYGEGYDIYEKAREQAKKAKRNSF